MAHNSLSTHNKHELVSLLQIANLHWRSLMTGCKFFQFQLIRMHGSSSSNSLQFGWLRAVRFQIAKSAFIFLSDCDGFPPKTPTRASVSPGACVMQWPGRWQCTGIRTDRAACGVRLLSACAVQAQGRSAAPRLLSDGRSALTVSPAPPVTTVTREPSAVTFVSR